MIFFRGRIGRFGYIVGNVLIFASFFPTMEWFFQQNVNMDLIIAYVTLVNFIHAVLVVKRLHDLDLPGNYYWKMMLPRIVYFKLGLMLFYLTGTSGVNQYGEEPTL